MSAKISSALDDPDVTLPMPTVAKPIKMKAHMITPKSISCARNRLPMPATS